MLKDIVEQEIVEIVIDSTGKLWINTEEGCILRIGHCKKIVLDDSYTDRKTLEYNIKEEGSTND